MSSLTAHFPGVLVQQVKHPRQCLISFSMRNTSSVSAPACLTPSSSGPMIKWLLLLRPRGLPLKTVTFITLAPLLVQGRLT